MPTQSGARDAATLWNSAAQNALTTYIDRSIHLWAKQASKVVLALTPVLLTFEILTPLAGNLLFGLVAIGGLFVLGLSVYIWSARWDPSPLSFLGIYLLYIGAASCASYLEVRLINTVGPVCTGILVIVATSGLTVWPAKHTVVVAIACAAAYLFPNMLASSAPAIQHTVRINGVIILIMGAFGATSTGMRFRAMVSEFKARYALNVSNNLLDQRDFELRADLDQAHQFQQRLMSRVPASPFCRWDTIYRPAEVLGGDWYDIRQLTETSWRVLMVDIAGHGVQACLRSMLLKSEYDKLARAEIAPWELLAQLNDAFIQNYGDETVLYTACCSELRREGAIWHIRHSNAGQPGILEVAADGPRWIEDNGCVQGAVAGVTYPQVERSLRANDRVFWYTDGLIEDRNAAGQTPFDGVQAALSNLNSTLQQASADALACCLQITGSTQPRDDITLVGVELRAG